MLAEVSIQFTVLINVIIVMQVSLFFLQGTMEQKIYERQINKLALAGRVVDEQQISRHFTDEEIKELYAFTAEEFVEGDVTPVPQLPAVSNRISVYSVIIKFTEQCPITRNKT